MRIETSPSTFVATPFAVAVGVVREESTESAKADVPWWEADLSGFEQMDAEDDVSMWQDAQVEAWASAL